MTTQFFRNYSSQGEQQLASDLVDELIAIHGVEVFYVPRVQMNTDTIMPDDKLSKFYNAYPITVYIKNIEGFGGQGDFLTQFGLELRDQITFTVSRKEFKKNVFDRDQLFQFTGRTWSGEPVLRPREGDIIYMPLNQKMYSIRFVEHEIPFYQFGKLQAFDLQSELYTPNNELYDTGVPEIDAIFAQYGLQQQTNDILTDSTGSDMLTSADGEYAIKFDVGVDPNSGSPEDHSEDIDQEANTIIEPNINVDPFGENT